MILEIAHLGAQIKPPPSISYPGDKASRLGCVAAKPHGSSVKSPRVGAPNGVRTDASHADADRRGPIYEDYTQRLRDLTQRCRAHEKNDRFAKHLYNHATSWFLFLVDPSIPATNHRAEQALKTPIVNRKVWGGNRTDIGGNAQAVLSSVLETCKNRSIDAFTFVSNALHGVVGNLFA